MEEGDVALDRPNKMSELAAMVTELTPNIDVDYESKRQSSEISDPISVDLEHGDSEDDIRMTPSPITEPVKTSPPLPRSRVNSDSVYLLDNITPSHLPLMMNHYTVPMIMSQLGAVQTEALPTDGHGIGDMDSNRSSGSPTSNLSALIQHQMEYYFSRDNLQNDSYLLSQMDGDQYVLIQTVAGFNQIKKLTTDINLIVEAIKDSPCLQIDNTGTKVRANVKRSVIILREIPESTSIEEVKNLFISDRCPNFATCEFAHNDSWYVSFDSEMDAHQAYRYLREEVKEFLGKPIYARIKGKSLQRTTYSKTSKPPPSLSQPSQQQQQSIFPYPPTLQPTTPITLYPAIQWPPQPFFDHNMPYTVNGYPSVAAPAGYHASVAHLSGGFSRTSSGGNHRNRGGGGGRSYSQGDQPTAPVHHHHQHNSSNSNNSQSLPPRYHRARDNDDSGRKGSRLRNSRRRDDYDKPARQQNKQLQKIDLEPSQFPPLVSQPTSNGSTTSGQGGVSEDGYAQAASMKGKKIATLNSNGNTTPVATTTTPVTAATNKPSAATPTTVNPVTNGAQLAASSNSKNVAEVKSAPVPAPATPPKSSHKVVSTAAPKITKQEPSRPAAAKPSRTDKDPTSNNRIAVKAKPDAKLSSHHTAKTTRRDKKKTDSKLPSPQQQSPKGSPQTDKKQIVPPPPSPPADTGMADKTGVKDASKPEKLSYALVAKTKPGEASSQPSSPPGETSSEPATSQPCSPIKCKDTLPM